MSPLRLCAIASVLACLISIASTFSFCPYGLKLYRCFGDPCDVTFCKGEPQAECHATYCGGCDAYFKLGDKKISYETADCPEKQAECLTDPCKGKTCTVRGVEAKCEKYACGRCGTRWYIEKKNGYIYDVTMQCGGYEEEYPFLSMDQQAALR